MNDSGGDLSVENIIEINEFALKKWGGLTPGIGLLRDRGTLEHIVYVVGRKKDPIDRVAYLIHAIATLHPFMDGNKRTAFLAANIAFASFGYTIDTSNEEVYSFVLLVADNQKTLKDVKKWVRQYMRAR